tara:strand:- start:3729 stop:4202 length:474 start_codon:yes stop_codon:yes gene_type:complete
MTYIHETAILDSGAEVGENTKIWHFTHIMSKAKIGESVSIGQNCFIGDNVVVGNNVKIQNNVSLYDGVIIENDVFVGPSVVFTNVKLPRSLESVNKNYTQTIVRKGVTLGANSTIICGVEIGENSFIGAGSVVTKDIPPNTMWYGNPAKQIKKMSRD